jgi:hypothetical protein
MRFLGCVVWYGRFIKNLHVISEPLRMLLKNVPEGEPAVKWEVDIPGTAQNLAFLELKHKFLEQPILRLPIYDERPFYIITDASQKGISGVLCQRFDGFEHPIAYFSRGLNQSQMRYHSYELETLALVESLKYFKGYTEACEIIAVTDCNSLSYWSTTKGIPANVERYLCTIQTFNCKFYHRPGKLIPLPDAFSRDERWNRYVKLTDEEIEAKKFDGKDIVSKEYHWTFETFKEMLKIREEMFHQEHHAGENARILGFTSDSVFHVQQKDILCQRTLQMSNWKNLTKHELTEKAKKEWGKKKGGEVITFFKLTTVAKDDFGQTLVYKKENDPLLRKKPYIPQGDLRHKLIKFFHNDPVAGHQGVPRSLAAITNKYWWKTITSDMTSHVRNCPCRMNKNEKPFLPHIINPLPISSNWEDINIDIGEFQNMANLDEPNWRVLVIVDRFTKSLELVVCYPDGEAISRKIQKRVFQRHGVPASIMTDNAPYFQEAWLEFFKKWGIRHEHGESYRHTTNGLAERTIRTIRTWLRNNMLDEPDFKKRLAACQWSLNTSVAKSHGYTPFMMEHLREPRDLSDNFLDPQLPGTTKNLSIKNFSKVREIAQKRLEENKATMIKQGNKPVDHTWVIGNLVYMRNLRETRTVEIKDAVQNYGPFQVNTYHTNPSKIWIVNPWVGTDSEFIVDKSTLIQGPQVLPEKQPIDPKQQFSIIHRTPAAMKAIKKLKKLLKIEDLKFSSLYGHRVKVNR